jgi:hypothetical protein
LIDFTKNSLVVMGNTPQGPPATPTLTEYEAKSDDIALSAGVELKQTPEEAKGDGSPL